MERRFIAQDDDNEGAYVVAANIMLCVSVETTKNCS